MDVIYIVIAVIVVIAAILFYKRRKREKEMPAGLQIFDENEHLIFDLANNTSYVLGTANTGAQDGSISDAKITARTWVIVVSCPANGQIPFFTVTQGKISWQFLGATKAPSPKNVTFMYGVY